MCSRHLTEMGSGVAEGQGESQRPFSLIKLLIKRITAKRKIITCTKLRKAEAEESFDSKVSLYDITLNGFW